MRIREEIVQATKIAFAYIGTVVGAGFASGQEIMRFFTVYGIYSIWPILIAASLFIFIGTKILRLGSKLNSQSYKAIIEHTFGIISPFVSGYIALAMVLIGAAMLAGSGALFNEYAGIPYWIGTGVTAAAALIVVLFGIKGILAINTWIVPLILMFSLIVYGYSLQGNGSGQEITAIYEITPVELVMNGVLYAAFNIILSIGVLSSAASKVKEPRALTIGGIMGGGILGIMIFINNYSLRAQGPGIYDYEVPMLYIVNHMGPLFSGLYAAVTWGAIFTTLIANFFSLSSVINDVFRVPVSLSLLMVTCLCFVISFMGFSQIVAFFYPLLGIFGFVLTVIMFVSTFKN
ncbi:MAG: hypothetical protein GX041_09810 [Clostridiales bacterium]|nr:hypothetical protein [Clostridiales bacterium]